jgi:ABC-type ATPase with predicted acetyltransferase domain
MHAVTIERVVCPAVEPSARVLETAAMFGLGVDERQRVTIVPRVTIPLPRPGVVFVTGPSGGGKSTILALIAEGCAAANPAVPGVPVVRDEALSPLPERPLVEALAREGEDLAATMARLARVGLGEAFVMLRSPGQLSDGQRCRARLAQLMAAAEARGEPAVVLIDELGATLDRVTACNLARQLRRWVDRTAHCLVCATSHDDLLEPLAPDVLVWKGLGEAIEVCMR